MTAPALLTRRQRNRSLLTRQLLVERAPVTIPAALERMGGLQAQYAPAMYIGLWSRMASFRRADLTGALQRRTVVQGTLQRGTIHLVSRADYWPFALAVRDARRRWWLGSQGRHTTDAQMHAAADALRTRLQADSPITRRQLDETVGRDLVNAVGFWIDLVRVPPSGTWDRRRADLYASADDWVGPPPDIDAEAACAHVVRRYLAGFGPASIAEIGLWAGVAGSTISAALPPRVRRWQGEDGVELVDLVGQSVADAESAVPVRFLPVWDATLLAHARRTGILAEEDRARIFTSRTPHSFNTFLVDGQVAGTWLHQDGRVTVEPFAPLSRRAAAEVDAEAERIGALYA